MDAKTDESTGGYHTFFPEVDAWNDIKTLPSLYSIPAHFYRMTSIWGKECTSLGDS
jgi:hypothetical protein